jgi:hypothetical protein
LESVFGSPPDKLGLLAAAKWALITVKRGRGLSVEQRVDLVERQDPAAVAGTLELR